MSSASVSICTILIALRCDFPLGFSCRVTLTSLTIFERRHCPDTTICLTWGVHVKVCQTSRDIGVYPPFLWFDTFAVVSANGMRVSLSSDASTLPSEERLIIASSEILFCADWMMGGVERLDVGPAFSIFWWFLTISWSWLEWGVVVISRLLLCNKLLSLLFPLFFLLFTESGLPLLMSWSYEREFRIVMQKWVNQSDISIQTIHFLTWVLDTKIFHLHRAFDRKFESIVAILRSCVGSSTSPVFFMCVSAFKRRRTFVSHDKRHNVCCWYGQQNRQSHNHVT